MQMTASSFWLPSWLGGRATRSRSLPLIRRHGPFLTGVPARYSLHAARSTQCCPMPSSVCAQTGSVHMDSPWLLLHGGACPKEPKMLSRREWIKEGLWSIPAFHYGLGTLLNRRISNEDDKVTSPPTRPFVVELPIPPVAQPVQKLDVAPDPAAHQRYSEFPPRVFYEIHQKEA